MEYGDLNHVAAFTAPNREMVLSIPLTDLFDESGKRVTTIRQAVFFSGVYDKAIDYVGRLAFPAASYNNSDKLAGHKWPSNLTDPRQWAVSAEFESLVDTKSWLFSQTLSPKLVNTVAMIGFGKFLWEVYDLMRFHDSPFEKNYFGYLYSKSTMGVLSKMEFNGTDVKSSVEHSIARWWLMYVIKTFGDEMPHFAQEFVSKLGITSPSSTVSASICDKAIKEIWDAIVTRSRKFLFECVEQGTGVRAYETVRHYLDEVSMTRMHTEETARIEIKIDPNAASGSRFIVTSKDKSAWYTHVRKVADSHMYQAYTLNEDGVLEPMLNSNELSEFVAGNLAFESGELRTVTKTLRDYLKEAAKGQLFIDVGRVGSMINENGFNVPHAVEGLSVIYHNATKDLIYSASLKNKLSGTLDALELDQKMRLEHLYHGRAFTVGEDSFEFTNAVCSELGQIMMQRVFALMIPETSATGNLVTSYDNIHGTVLIDGSDLPSGSWIRDLVIGGAKSILYNNTAPVLSFLSRLQLRNVPVDNSKEVFIGSDLAQQFYTILKDYGFAELKSAMIGSRWTGTPSTYPGSNNMLTGWTTAFGQENALKGLGGYGSFRKEAQCVKSLFSTVSSSSLLDAFTRCVSLFLGYDMSTITLTSLLIEWKDAATTPED